ncbi:MAG: response regulator transcription factor [Acidimicrobiales bacterium]
MLDVVVASDEAWVRAEVAAVLSALADVAVHEVTSGFSVLPAVPEYDPELIIVDLQIGNMGGMAACMELRLEESAGRIAHVPVLMLLDRRPDVFLARRAGAEGWLVKPLDPIRLRKAIRSLLDGGAYHDEAHKPATV